MIAGPPSTTPPGSSISSKDRKHLRVQRSSNWIKQRLPLLEVFREDRLRQSIGKAFYGLPEHEVNRGVASVNAAVLAWVDTKPVGSILTTMQIGCQVLACLLDYVRSSTTGKERVARHAAALAYALQFEPEAASAEIGSGLLESLEQEQLISLAELDRDVSFIKAGVIMRGCFTNLELKAKHADYLFNQLMDYAKQLNRSSKPIRFLCLQQRLAQLRQAQAKMYADRIHASLAFAQVRLLVALIKELVFDDTLGADRIHRFDKFLETIGAHLYLQPPQVCIDRGAGDARKRSPIVRLACTLERRGWEVREFSSSPVTDGDLPPVAKALMAEDRYDGPILAIISTRIRRKGGRVVTLFGRPRAVINDLIRTTGVVPSGDEFNNQWDRCVGDLTAKLSSRIPEDASLAIYAIRPGKNYQQGRTTRFKLQVHKLKREDYPSIFRLFN